MNTFYIIGCGGVGSWLCASLQKLIGGKSIVLIDGDKFEEKNLDRQLFNSGHIGTNKATALASLYAGMTAFESWYASGVLAHDPGDWLLVCVDNNAARISALEACDHYQCNAIFAANETTSSEAYLYLPEWRGSKRDPRIMYPEMAEDTGNDPQRRTMGCVGVAQTENRQLVSANFMAAALAQHLLVCWYLELPQVKPENVARVRPNLPHKLVSNVSQLETFACETTDGL